MNRLIVVAGLLCLACFGASAGDAWTRYLNARYGYSVEVPPGFSPIAEAGNGDGGTARSPAGNATLGPDEVRAKLGLTKRAPLAA